MLMPSLPPLAPKPAMTRPRAGQRKSPDALAVALRLRRGRLAASGCGAATAAPRRDGAASPAQARASAATLGCSTTRLRRPAPSGLGRRTPSGSSVADRRPAIGADLRGSGGAWRRRRSCRGGRAPGRLARLRRGSRRPAPVEVSPRRNLAGAGSRREPMRWHGAPWRWDRGRVARQRCGSRCDTGLGLDGRQGLRLDRGVAIGAAE